MIRDEQIARLMGIGALALLLGALGFQYFAHLAPCEMCHWQRWPHIAAFLVGLVGISVWKWDSRMLVVLVVALVIALGVIITGQWQNVFFAAIAAVLLIAAGIWEKGARSLAILTVLLVAVSGLIGAYQTGMQMGLLPGPSACTGARFVLGSGAPPSEVSCNAVTWSLFGLSLAAYNAVISLALAATGTFLLSRNHAA